MSYSYVIAKLSIAQACVEQARGKMPENHNRDVDVEEALSDIMERLRNVESVMYGEKHQAAEELWTYLNSK